MSGKPGQRSTLSTQLPPRWAADFLNGLDERCRVARALKQRVRALSADLGGFDGLSTQERLLCMRVAYVEALIQGQETALAHGQSINVNSYLQAVTVLSSLLKSLGLKRRPKPAPSLQEFLVTGGKKSP
ncbi:hypothetical protein MYX04_12465 [Nitrospiraceae bacterium AH_259_D15_M11_P09]|nr:hypothetical protein [Nitrospiraceae bacterium AH_259_D15_M11_P09]